MRRRAIPDASQGDLFAEVRQDGLDASAQTRILDRHRRSAMRRIGAPPLAPDEEELARRLEAGGRYRVLRRLEARPVRPLPPVRPASTRIGVVLDTETTGLDHARDEIVELGMVAFTYDEAGIGEVVGVFSELREPTVPISSEITRITGITPEMAAGRVIDLEAVRRFVEPADLVIAHNARFDRPFCERFAPGFEAKAWACSVAEVDWTGLGFEGTKLGYLVGQSGLFHNGHRAVDDCHALLEVLSRPSRTAAEPPFRQLVRSVAQARLRLFAIASPFHTKDILKARGYRWNDGSDGRPKCWWREIAEDAREDETEFLRREVYRADVDLHVPAPDRPRALQGLKHRERRPLPPARTSAFERAMGGASEPLDPTIDDDQNA